MSLGDRLQQFVARLRRPGDDPDATYHVVRGVRVAMRNDRPDIDGAFVLERLDAALALIERYQPWRFRHIRRDVAELLVVRWPCRGAYLPDRRAILTELSFLARAAEFTPAQVASSILHEGVHARVHRMGVRPVDANRAREERLCRRAELAFGRALPPELGAPVVERAEATLAYDDAAVAPVVDWAEAHQKMRAADAGHPPRGRA